ncbi:MAG: hypothetical protein FJ207_08665 [Gemmatimonadetes bacterium]|nr:hypothetical protein [Gemmatimonadota bacterium]
MPFTKDDIDAVSITLLVNEDTAFQVYLTRGGLTQRMGFSERADPAAILLKGGTDAFEPYLGTIPDSLLAGEGGLLDAGPGDGPKHDWRFELAGGMNSLVYDVSYHAGSASLPDEFADMVVHAERLTHSWYTALLAEETRTPLPSSQVEVAPPAPRAAPASKGKPRGKSASASPTSTPAKAGASKSAPQAKSAPSSRGGTLRTGSGPALPITRERLGLAILLDFIAWMIPWQFLAWIIGGGGERSGPPGASIVVFAVIEFVLLQVLRKSPGYWLLGISSPHGSKPLVDSMWPARESKETQAFGVALCALGVAGLTSWTLYRTPVPYFGLGFPLWLSLPLAVAGSAALVLAGALAWERWGGFVDAAVAARSAYEGSPVGQGLLGILLDLVQILAVAIPVALGVGAFLSWKRLAGPASAQATSARAGS